MEGRDGFVFLLLTGLILRDVSVLNVVDLSVNDLRLNAVGSLDQLLALSKHKLSQTTLKPISHSC